ncbi:hypothetical protein [Actinokineospora pegani]|uniref:hypothetical protein n=1 Tax=Actinokineospora pegani TaxID=2654637 RepID=UPI0012EACB73|nr:hypothetical protein [Actinokineospora pegani]
MRGRVLAWCGVAIVGVAVVVGAVVVVVKVGLERSDQVASVVGAVCGVLGLVAAVVGAARASTARNDSTAPGAGSRVTQTVSGSEVKGSIIQIGGNLSGPLPHHRDLGTEESGDDQR